MWTYDFQSVQIFDIFSLCFDGSTIIEAISIETPSTLPEQSEISHQMTFSLDIHQFTAGCLWYTFGKEVQLIMRV
jgi:hypothetical protein